MTKRVAAKHKVDRQFGENLWGRAKSPLNVRNYGPGQHGQQRKKLTDYGIQLRAKQKLKKYYAFLSERQFRAIYEEAVRRRGDTSENIIELLERRLASVIYRMKFAPTVFSARQLVSHGHVKVNGKRVNIPSFMVKDGDEITVSTALAENVVFLQGAQSSERDVPDYMAVDHKKMSGHFVRAPKLADVPYPVRMEPSQVIEFYSR